MARELTPLFAFAALFALTACYLWFRFLGARSWQSHNGCPPSWRWMTEAVAATALALGLCGGGYLLSLFL